MTTSPIVLITGTSSGFGYLTATLLAASGYKVYAAVRQPKDLKIFDTIDSKIRPQSLLLDVTWSQTKINQAIKKIISQSKKIDVLINNAGYGSLGAVESLSVEDLEAQFAVNVFGTFKVTKAVLPYMRSHHSGLVINISSIAGLLTFAGYGAYSASKFALEALTQSLHAEESTFGIDVVALNPGSFTTKFWVNQTFPSSPSKKPPQSLWRFNQTLASMINKPSSRRGDPQVVAKKIKSIIESKHRHLNNLVGLDAHLIFLASKLIPRSLFLFLTKKVVKRLA